LEGGYGNAPETIRRAIGLGVVGANIEDQLKPLAEAAKQVADIMRVAEEEGVDFVLNARTDAFALRRQELMSGGDPEVAMQDAIERGKARRDAGAPVVSVQAIPTEDDTDRVVEADAPRRLTTTGTRGNPPREWQQEHEVERNPTRLTAGEVA